MISFQTPVTSILFKGTSNHPPISPHPDLTVHSKEINESHIPLFPLSPNQGVTPNFTISSYHLFR